MVVKMAEVKFKVNGDGYIPSRSTPSKKVLVDRFSILSPVMDVVKVKGMPLPKAMLEFWTLMPHRHSVCGGKCECGQYVDHIILNINKKKTDKTHEELTVCLWCRQVMQRKVESCTSPCSCL